MATTPPFDPQPPVQSPLGVPPAPPKKKMGALGWVLIGCGGLMVVALVVICGLYFFVMHKVKQAGLDPELLKSNPGLAVAKMAVAANPDLEIIDEDDSRGIIRIHDRKQNKNFLVNMQDAKRGRFTLQEEGKEAVTLSASGSGANGAFEMKSSEGTLKLGGGAQVNLPSWVPSYPGSQPQASMTSETNNGKTVAYSFKTSDAVDKVVDFYKSGLTSAGLTISNSATFASNGTNGGVVAASDNDKKREISVSIGTELGQSVVSVTFTEKP